MPREQAFAVLSHFDRVAEWDPGIDEATMLTPEPVRQGSRFALRARFLGRSLPLEYEIIDFEPDTRLVLRAENPFVRSVDTISFETRPGTTEVTYDAHLEPKGLARLAAPVLAFAFSRIGDRAATGLRRHLNPAGPA